MVYNNQQFQKHPYFKKKRFYLFILERAREGEREGGKHQCVVVSCASPITRAWDRV